MNIVYMHSHDTGRCIEPYGYPVRTPRLAAFAERAVVFRNAFCAAPTCSPSRAALLTGATPHVNGMLGLTHRGFALSDYSQHIVSTLKKAGYHTALSGVQHVASSWEQIGYHEYLGGPSAAETNAEDFLRRPPTAPFFLSVGFFETHRQFPALDSAAEADGARAPAPLPDVEQTRTDAARYARSATLLDAKMGRVLDAIDESSLSNDTLIIVTTDHGIAFPGMKCNLNDAGTGVMLMVAGPNQFSRHRTVDAMVSHLDVFPTICELLSIDRPPWLEGQSLLPLVTGEVASLHDELFAEVNYHAAYEPMRTVRTERYRYVRRYDGRTRPVLPNCDDSESKAYLMANGWGGRRPDQEALYDLVFDAYETNNIVDDPRHRDILADLRNRLQLWMEETDDPLRHGWVAAPHGATLNDPDAPSNKSQSFRAP